MPLYLIKIMSCECGQNTDQHQCTLDSLVSWKPVEASKVWLRAHSTAGKSWHHYSPCNSISYNRADILSYSLSWNEPWQVECGTRFQQWCREAGNKRVHCGGDWPWEIYILWMPNQPSCRFLYWCSSHPTSVPITLSYLLYSLLSARGIWSCHSDNVLRPTRKQTEHKAFVYWWQMPRFCLTFSLWTTSFCAVTQLHAFTVVRLTAKIFLW